MIKIPRYMKEYANVQRKSYLDNELMHEKFKDSAVKAIDNILRNTEHGLITLNEGMKMLCNPLNEIIL